MEFENFKMVQLGIILDKNPRYTLFFEAVCDWDSRNGDESVI